MNRLVLDASVTLAWCFEGERDAYAAAALMRLAAGDEAVAPSIWPYEIVNGVRSGEHRGRIAPAASDRFIERLAQYPIVVESPPGAADWSAVLRLAREKLSAYDAAYLDLAMRMQLPLITLDAKLHTAARKAGVPTGLPH